MPLKYENSVIGENARKCIPYYFFFSQEMVALNVCSVLCRLLKRKTFYSPLLCTCDLWTHTFCYHSFMVWYEPILSLNCWIKFFWFKKIFPLQRGVVSSSDTGPIPQKYSRYYCRSHIYIYIYIYIYINIYIYIYIYI